MTVFSTYVSDFCVAVKGLFCNIITVVFRRILFVSLANSALTDNLLFRHEKGSDIYKNERKRNTAKDMEHYFLNIISRSVFFSSLLSPSLTHFKVYVMSYFLQDPPSALLSSFRGRVFFGSTQHNNHSAIQHTLA
jgi:hypothetical protein